MADDRIPVLVGCTASGKSASAMAFALRNTGVEIVNGDSRQLYRGMDIGTAKPCPEDRAMVPHHLLDVADPDTLLSAGWYARQAQETLREILNRGGRPLIVGGSALYLMALAGMTDPLPPRNDNLRKSLSDLEESSPGALYRILRSLDPETAVAPTDTVRLLRALEICLESGSRATELRQGGNVSDSFMFVMLESEPVALRTRIDERVDQMVKNGLPSEVEGLSRAGYGREPVLGHTIGYREMLDHMDGLCSLDEAVTAMKTNTWRYARRQRNMFKRLPGLLRAGSPEAAATVLDGRGANGQGQ
ncbi:MAG: tRNA (adenosine(37)-N6)-dimethylallyltransferase MiaA [Candidatus Fermentibacteraceae bacterium]